MMKSSASLALQGDGLGDNSSVASHSTQQNHNKSASTSAAGGAQPPPQPPAALTTTLPPPLSQYHSPTNGRKNGGGDLNLFRMVLGNCYCEPAAGLVEGLSPTIQFVELHGIRFIGLGCMSDELTPRERVYDTLEQLTDRSERLLSIGYVVVPPKEAAEKTDTTTQTIPLDVWAKHYPRDAATSQMARPVQNLVEQIKNRDYKNAKLHLSMQLSSQKKNLSLGNNRYLAGITAHNLAVVKILSGDEHGVVPLFEEAIALKERAFGRNCLEVAYSWDELGIQLFAGSDFEQALSAFSQAQKVRRSLVPGNGGASADDWLASGSDPTLAAGMAMVLNNIACCNFQLRNFKSALLTLQEAQVLQQTSTSKQPQCADLDLLYNAIVMNNCGYLHLCLKLYEDARSLFEEALLIQQSVLDESHRAIRDTRSNLEFTNAFHL